MQNLTTCEVPLKTSNVELINKDKDSDSSQKADQDSSEIEQDCTTIEDSATEAEAPPEKPVWTPEKFTKSKRRVNIDITPKLCYSAGSMVELLRSSNCSRYLDLCIFYLSCMKKVYIICTFKSCAMIL